MSNAEAQHDAVTQGISVLADILETPRWKCRKLCSMCCRLLDGESWYTHVPCGSGSEGADCTSGFSKSMQNPAAASVLLFPEYEGDSLSVPLSWGMLILLDLFCTLRGRWGFCLWIVTFINLQTGVWYSCPSGIALYNANVCGESKPVPQPEQLPSHTPHRSLLFLSPSLPPTSNCNDALAVALV